MSEKCDKDCKHHTWYDGPICMNPAWGMRGSDSEYLEALKRAVEAGVFDVCLNERGPNGYLVLWDPKTKPDITLNDVYREYPDGPNPCPHYTCQDPIDELLRVTDAD